ncbi:hypothetical protein [Amycolatopsis suaedae]|uniref:Enoyl-CoA hydratase/isomerase family protein n=1 Tax=Amycolatopsis suaedae TaxID=2510978 RepID=A0A4Q7J2P6_9PSEU|nr:hypothetical protein [Amycolatopsis suaedae]RZQ61028.1 hypothetical protein EWH70_26560 [Amycolatopsis suaedae]
MRLVSTRRDRTVLTIRLNNPPFNFLTMDMLIEPEKLLGEIHRDLGLRAVVLTSHVPGVFVSHYDVGEFSLFKGCASATGQEAVWPGVTLFVRRSAVLLMPWSRAGLGWSRSVSVLPAHAGMIRINIDVAARPNRLPLMPWCRRRSLPACPGGDEADPAAGSAVTRCGCSMAEHGQCAQRIEMGDARTARWPWWCGHRCWLESRAAQPDEPAAAGEGVRQAFVGDRVIGRLARTGHPDGPESS